MFLLKGVGYRAHALFLSGLLLFGPVQAAESDWLWHKLLTSGGLNQAHLISKETFRQHLVSKSDASAACHYPARAYIALNDKKLFEQAISNCDDLNEFRRRVPFQELSLVFAAEDIASPASNMGHVFLQVSGNDAEGNRKSYGISYLTEISGNPVSLGYSLLFGGRRGGVTLGPASQEITKYVDLSKRTVWITPVDVTDINLEFMQLYLWELRQNTPKYFFVQFNCATFINHLISVSGKRRNEKLPIFQTPRELFNSFVNEQDPDVQIYPSVDWFLDALRHEGEKEYTAWLASADNNLGTESNADLNTSSLLYASNFTEKLRRKNKLENKQALQRLAYFQRELDTRKGEAESFFAENVPRPSSFFRPNKLSLGVSASDNNDAVILQYRPAAIDVYSFQPLSFGVQENVLASSIWSLSEETGNARLEQADIFSMSSLRPWSKANPAYSFRTRLAFERLLDGKKQTTFTYKGGVSRRILNDVLVYALAGAGAGKQQGIASKGIGLIELGLKLNLLADFSFIATRSFNLWGFDETKKQIEDSLVLQRAFSRDYSLDISYKTLEKEFNADFSGERFQLSISRYF
ncbi:DUF4105 domain-containing protein [Alphaproteobacteria bacterium]|nr:DUF4105 domain-containing protein [Alphaproteobacteria bacterium]